MIVLNRKIAPPTRPVTQIVLPVPCFTRLDNGIPLYILNNAQLDLIHIVLVCQTGLLYEKQKYLTQFTYALLKESSPRHSSNEMADLLAFNGAQFNTGIAADHTRLSVSVPKDKLLHILPTIFECMMRPRYRNANVQLYRNLIFKDLEYNNCKTDFRATQRTLNVMFGNGLPAGQFPSKKDLQAVTITQMRDWHKQTFCAENIRLFVTGNIDPAMERLIIRLFAQVPRGRAAEELPEFSMPVDKTPEIYEEMPDCVQSSIVLSRPLFGFMHPDRHDFVVLDTLVGGYFSSRLMQNLREKNGYTYNVVSNIQFFGCQALFSIAADVNIKDTRAAVDACFNELDRLRNELVPEEELHNVQNYMLGQLLRNVDNTVSYQRQYCFWNHFGLDERELQAQIQHIRQMTPQRIRELAKKYLRYNNFTRIIVGKIDSR